MEAGKDIPGVFLTGRNSGMVPSVDGSQVELTGAQFPRDGWDREKNPIQGLGKGKNNSWEKWDGGGPQGWAGFWERREKGMRWEQGFGIWDLFQWHIPAGSVPVLGISLWR